ncbi:cupin domain-containing protein [Aestuariivirga litoralis]|uniref:Cupin domain-containing protein n=1 Tax=Aestuariivirga litoralis TaxID=2650924 RepID=A0A2W2BSI3_9HYPH|nr:cupin domain-containing protein [Aestuariivirga litoralis]PZF76406.1 cupin domain-containing protein [Aestuariivirga litoralis]
MSAVFTTTAASADAVAPVTRINGQTPPGRLLPLEQPTVMLDTLDSNGNRVVVMKGIRKAGTRVGIHIHRYGGHTCVLSGVITDFVEGHAPMIFPAGSCYYMPAGVPMTAANLGTQDAELIDNFILPPGEPMITILEPGYP